MFEFWTKWCREGVQLPFAFDAETKKPSVTLMYLWITSFLSIFSLIALHLQIVTYTATAYSLVFVLAAFVMYRLRKLDKVKIDVEHKSIDLEGKEETNDKA